VLSAALDSATQILTMVIFFCLNGVVQVRYNLTFFPFKKENFLYRLIKLNFKSIKRLHFQNGGEIMPILKVKDASLQINEHFGLGNLII